MTALYVLLLPQRLIRHKEDKKAHRNVCDSRKAVAQSRRVEIKRNTSHHHPEANDGRNPGEHHPHPLSIPSGMHTRWDESGDKVDDLPSTFLDCNEEVAVGNARFVLSRAAGGRIGLRPLLHECGGRAEGENDEGYYAHCYASYDCPDHEHWRMLRRT